MAGEADTLEPLLDHLEAMLGRMTRVAELELDALAQLTTDWEAGVARLSEVSAGQPRHSAAAARLAALIHRLPEVQEVILRHKSQLAQMMMTENQRLRQLQREQREAGEWIATDRQA